MELYSPISDIHAISKWKNRNREVNLVTSRDISIFKFLQKKMYCKLFSYEQIHQDNINEIDFLKYGFAIILFSANTEHCSGIAAIFRVR